MESGLQDLRDDECEFAGCGELHVGSPQAWAQVGGHWARPGGDHVPTQKADEKLGETEEDEQATDEAKGGVPCGRVGAAINMASEASGERISGVPEEEFEDFDNRILDFCVQDSMPWAACARSASMPSAPCCPRLRLRL